jgi:hypothetical protein
VSAKTKTKSTINFFGWRKDDSKRHRRAVVLERCHNNKLLAGQVLLEIHNRSRDPEARKLARADALHFFKLCKGNGNRRTHYD